MSTSAFPAFDRARRYQRRTAIVADGVDFTYGQLLADAASLAGELLGSTDDLREQRVAYLVPPGYQHVVVQWAIWGAGGIAVPLALSHPKPELDYVIRDAEATSVVVHPALRDRLPALAEGCRLRALEPEIPKVGAETARPSLGPTRPAMILYTSGTTGKPKGVVLTFGNLEAQITSLVQAWGWTAEDRILHVLPLQHLHGIVNVLLCALWVGAVCEFLPRFEAEAVWERILTERLTLFMAVPTIYVRLIDAWERASPGRREALAQACSRLRLTVSGSAALPVEVLRKWEEMTGHVLLERYGMTEIGMALSNPLEGERIAGTVGRPLPGIEVRLRREDGRPVKAGMPGEIEVRGPSVFREYWRREQATREAFRDGWFRTGDVAVEEKGVYRILGRESIDIIKTGGYKVSALEIEEVLRSHRALADCAVVGVQDREWGECVCAAVVLKGAPTVDAETLRAWAKERLARYKVPSRLLFVDELPRNAMGKVNKPAVKQLFRESPP